VSSDLSTQELLNKMEELGDRVSMELIQSILSRGHEIILPLGSILQDRQYWEVTDERMWMPLHAVKLLGTLADAEALPYLIEALSLAAEMIDDWVMEDLPTAFGRIGHPAIEPLMEVILARKGENKLFWVRSTAVEGLVAITIHHPRERERVLSFLHELFKEEEDPEFLAFNASVLLDLYDPSSFPVLEQAFDRGFIDKAIIDREELLEIPDKELFSMYTVDLLDFYDPEQVAERQVRWEEEKKREKEEEERREYEKQKEREEREKSIAIELKRLEDTNTLRELNILPLINKLGRNEPCPCGSGKKYKKCHMSVVKNLPPTQVLSKDPLYGPQEDLERAKPYDTKLIIENLSELASDALMDGDVARTLEIFKKLEPLAEQEGLLENFLRYWNRICSSSPELGEEGVAIMRKLQSYYQDKDKSQWVFNTIDLADCLGLLERWDEGRKEFEVLIEEMPESLLIHTYYAHFLVQAGNIDEAVNQYKRVIQMRGQVEEDENIKIAASVLKELASRHSLELDPETRQAIKQILDHEE
jgi:tetratricopeptide (TPR) repeat protein